MAHACHRFSHCYKTLTFGSLLTRCTIPCACYAERHLNVQKCSVPVRFLHFWLRHVLRTTMVCTFSTSQLPKVLRSCCALYMLTSKRASGHNCVHFFDISTSKSHPNMRCFVHLDFQMCFAPQRCALFWHLNFQKWSENRVFCTFWLPNVLRATTACNFSSLIWPDGSAPAALASLLFDPPEPQIMEKHSASRLSYLFAHPHHLHLLVLSLLWHLCLSEIWLLNFLRLFCDHWMGPRVWHTIIRNGSSVTLGSERPRRQEWSSSGDTLSKVVFDTTSFFWGHRGGETSLDVLRCCSM